MAARPPALLRVPGRLAVLAIGLVSSSCTTPATQDVNDVQEAGLDIADEIALEDTGIDRAVPDTACEVLPGGAGYECIPDLRADVRGTCPSARTCQPAVCPVGCVSCYGAAYTPAGYACVRDPRGSPTVACPTQRVCNASDCPAGCVGCASPYGCVALPLADGALPPQCVPSVVCDINDCSPECQALG